MTDYEKLKGIIDEIDSLVAKSVVTQSPEFQAWKTKTERFLIYKFGNGSYEHNLFTKTHFFPITMGRPASQGEIMGTMKNGLTKTKAILSTYLDELQEDKLDSPITATNWNYTKIFVVHGHDGELKQSVARIIEKQGIEAIILSEQANKGRTIIEKFEDYSDVGGAICLFTADDYGRAKKDTLDNTRARQNVVLETGYFMGKLGRDHVVLLADKGIEMPSDLSGVVYTDTAKWEIDLLKELKATGYVVDFNKLF